MSLVVRASSQKIVSRLRRTRCGKPPIKSTLTVSLIILIGRSSVRNRQGENIFFERWFMGCRGRCRVSLTTFISGPRCYWSIVIRSIKFLGRHWGPEHSPGVITSG